MSKEIFNSIEEVLKKYPEKPLGKAKDLSGQKYNRLQLILRVDRKTSNTGASWACKCNCGNYIVTLGSQVISGHTTSCGCYNKELVAENCKKIGEKPTNAKDYTLVENPYYTFVKKLDKKDKKNNYIWKIECKKCGKSYEEVPAQLISDTRRKGNNPCECWRNTSKGVLKIISILEENKIPFEKEFKFNDCVSPKGNQMKFDFFINNNYIIEYDGEQHFSEQSFGDSNSKEKFEKQKLYDNIKNKYCIENNIPIIRIPYTAYNNLCLNDLKIETSDFLFKGEKNG